MKDPGAIGSTTVPGLAITLSADFGKLAPDREVKRAKKTNRVFVRKAKRTRREARAVKWRRDPRQALFQDLTQVCVSMPLDERNAIDRAASAVNMSRSMFLRRAAKRFATWLEHERVRSFEEAIAIGGDS